MFEASDGLSRLPLAEEASYVPKCLDDFPNNSDDVIRTVFPAPALVKLSNHAGMLFFLSRVQLLCNCFIFLFGLHNNLNKTRN